MTVLIDLACTRTARNYDDVIIVTGSDSRFFSLACDLITTIERHRPGPVTLGFYDLGLTDNQRGWLQARGVITVDPETGLDAGMTGMAGRGSLAYLARPYLRENFPGFSTYVWLDADTWLQDWSGIQALCDGALSTGAAVVRQDERAYYVRPWLLGWQLKHFVLGYGVLAGPWLATRAHINDGVFALRHDVAHWRCWQWRYERAFARTLLAGPHDQFSLNAAVYLDRLPTLFLPATCNWICDLAAPMWNVEQDKLCVPYAPYQPIGILHLAGPAKANIFDIKATDGTQRRGPLRYAQDLQIVTVQLA